MLFKSLCEIYQKISKILHSLDFNTKIIWGISSRLSVATVFKHTQAIADEDRNKFVEVIFNFIIE